LIRDAFACPYRSTCRAELTLIIDGVAPEVGNWTLSFDDALHAPFVDDKVKRALQGQSGIGISLRQILPNVQPIVTAQAVSSLGFAVVDLAAVSFLGLGVQPPTADLGLMVKSGFDSMLRGQPGEAISAGLAIVLIVWSITVIGDRLTSNARSHR